MITKMASLIAMNPDPSLTSVEREIRQEIMKTDIFIRILGPREEQPKLQAHLDQAFELFRQFERRFTRFKKESELSQFNEGQGGKVSPALWDILTVAKTYSTLTQGVFDPAILPALESVGYRGASDAKGSISLERHSISELVFDEEHATITKPASLRIDLGGIGKGYCVDQVSRELRQWGHVNFVIDAGGDIYVSGMNVEEGYPYWVLEVEDPHNPSASVATVVLNDEAIATSGRNRRTWTKEGRVKHHIINPTTQDSASNELMTVSVIAPTTTAADIWAKTLFILGLEKGLERAKEQGLAALFIDTQGQCFASSLWAMKLWSVASQPALAQATTP